MSSEAEGETKEALASSTYRTSAERVGANSGDLMTGPEVVCVCVAFVKRRCKKRNGKGSAQDSRF